MKTILLCTFLLVLCSLASSSFFPETTSPVLAWSGSDVFYGKNMQYLERTNTEQIIKFINTMQAKQKSTMKIVSDLVNYPKPEIIVVFIGNNQDFHTQKIAKFQGLMTSTKTSVVIPYNYLTKYSIPSEDLISSMSMYKKVIIAEEISKGVSNTNKKYISTSNLLEFLGSTEEKDYIFDRKTSPELIVVHIESIEDSQTFIESVNQRVSEITNGNYVGILLSDKKVEHIQETIEVVHHQLNVMKRDEYADATDDDSFFPPSIWESLLISGLLIFLLLIGVSCTASVQTPKRWGTGKYTCQFTEIPDP